MDRTGAGKTLLGHLGQHTEPVYSYAYPGGPEQLTVTLQRGPRFHDAALEHGKVVQACRGAEIVWDGKLDEPAFAPGEGWQITAHGAGTFGADYMAENPDGVWAHEPDASVNSAIARGLRWVNPGIGHPDGLWLGQRADNCSQTVTALLDLVTSRGGLGWYVGRRNVLDVSPLPTAPTRRLITASPPARTLGGDLNRIWIRYQATADSTDLAGRAHPATFTHTFTDNPDSVSIHDPIEGFADVSSAGVLTVAEAQQVGTFILARYTSASWAGPLTAGPGDLTNLGGTPVDLGSEQAGEVVALLFTDYGYGAEWQPYPPKFVAGGYEYDGPSGTATITPLQTLDLSALIGIAPVPVHVRRRGPIPRTHPLRGRHRPGRLPGTTGFTGHRRAHPRPDRGISL